MPEKNDKYQANRDNDIISDDKDDNSSKKTAKLAAKGAADYFTGGKGGAIVDKLADTKLGNKALNSAGKALEKHPGFSKVAKKLDDSGALDTADDSLSMIEGKNAMRNNQGISKNDTNPVSENIASSNNKNSLGIKNFIGSKKSSNLNDNSDEDTELDSSGNYDFSSELSGEVKTNILSYIPLKVKIGIGVCGFFLFLILSYLVMLSDEFDGSNKDKTSITSSACSTISLKTTSLTEEEFTKLLESKKNLGPGYNLFYENASTIYNLATNNNINPEMVVLRAVSEGFSPGSSHYNYWGLGCTNNGGIKACISYSSFSEGVLGYIKNISKYDTVTNMMSKYAYIGDYWYSPGSSSRGGCYYYPYIKKYLSSERSSQVGQACSNNCSDSACLKTTDEDQNAYASWQVEKMVDTRKTVFNVAEDKCDSTPVTSSGNGSEIAQYAIDTFDSFSYSQANRMSSTAVDCSSLVWRTYNHFGINFGSKSYAPTAQGEYNWCKNNNKIVSENDLQAGDLIFWNHGTSEMQHVAIYVGNNKQFAARSSRYAQPDQVSVTSYYKGSGNSFCRP